MLMVNAYKLHNFANEDSNLSLYKFRLEVVGALLPEKQQAVPSRPPRNATHVLSKINKRDAKGSHIRVRCRVCLEEGRKIPSPYIFVPSALANQPCAQLGATKNTMHQSKEERVRRPLYGKNCQSRARHVSGGCCVAGSDRSLVTSQPPSQKHLTG
ncbi:hypothetical protein J6590_091253 [Homalodisca vitripennis]|nr:hypothetical protein J6590_091253 [Homalodisca vitripennis]